MLHQTGALWCVDASLFIPSSRSTSQQTQFNSGTCSYPVRFWNQSLCSALTEDIRWLWFWTDSPLWPTQISTVQQFPLCNLTNNDCAIVSNNYLLEFFSQQHPPLSYCPLRQRRTAGEKNGCSKKQKVNTEVQLGMYSWNAYRAFDKNRGWQSFGLFH